MRQQLGRHELLVRLAAGGAANVFLARDISPNAPARLLALKVLLPNLAANEDFLKMFFTEAKIAAQLRHENIVQIAGFGRIDGIHSLAMEYVFGASLAQILRQSARVRKPLTVGVLLRIAASVCSALHYAHELKDESGQPMSLVHRDVTPQNILVGFNGKPKLTDFGIAKAVNRGFETQVGVVKGKFCYMSPEQALGKKVDQRADIFGLGIVLWEALTGRDLFKGSSPMEVIAAIREQEIVPPSQVVQGLSPIVDPIVMKALKRAPRSRYQTAQQMQQSIEDLIQKAGVKIDDQTISNELATIFGDVVQKRALALKEATHGQPDIEKLCEVLNAQPLKTGQLPSRKHDEIDEEDPLGLFAGQNRDISLPPMGLTGLVPALPEQGFTATFDRDRIREELAQSQDSIQSVSDDDIAELSELELEDFPKELSDENFAPIDSWNDQTEMIEDHDEFLDLVSSTGLNWPSDTLSSVESHELPEQLSDSATIAGMRSLSLSEGDQDRFEDDAILAADNTESEVRAIEPPVIQGSIEAQDRTDGRGLVGLLVGEQLPSEEDSARNVPRAPSLSIKDYSAVEPGDDASSSNVSSISSLASSRTRTSKPFKLRPLTNDDMEVLSQPNAEQARLIVGSTPPPPRAESQKSEVPEPIPLPEVITPQVSQPNNGFDDRPPAPVIPLNQQLSDDFSASPPAALPTHDKMVTLRKDVLALLTIASILFGIALGLGIAKIIGLPTLP